MVDYWNILPSAIDLNTKGINFPMVFKFLDSSMN